MSDELTRLFDEFDRGRLSRRQLLMALGMAVAIRPGRMSTPVPIHGGLHHCLRQKRGQRSGGGQSRSRRRGSS